MKLTDRFAFCFSKLHAAARSTSTRPSEHILAVSTLESIRAQPRAALSNLNGHTARTAVQAPHARIAARSGLIPTMFITRVRRRLRDQYRSLDPVGLLAEIRATQEELGNRVDRRAGQARGLQPACTSTAPATAATFAKTLGKTVAVGETRATHRRPRRPYKTRVRMPSKLDPVCCCDRGLARRAAAVNRTRDCRPAERERPRGVRDETAFDRAASAQGA